MVDPNKYNPASPRHDAAGKARTEPPRDAQRRRPRAPPLIDVTPKEISRRIWRRRVRAPASRRAVPPWKWILGAAAGGASIAAAITVVWAFGTARLDDDANSSAPWPTPSHIAAQDRHARSRRGQKPADRPPQPSTPRSSAPPSRSSKRGSTPAPASFEQVDAVRLAARKARHAKRARKRRRVLRSRRTAGPLHGGIATISTETTGSNPKPTPPRGAAAVSQTTAVSPPRKYGPRKGRPTGPRRRARSTIRFCAASTIEQRWSRERKACAGRAGQRPARRGTRQIHRAASGRLGHDHRGKNNRPRGLGAHFGSWSPVEDQIPRFPA